MTLFGFKYVGGRNKNARYARVRNAAAAYIKAKQNKQNTTAAKQALNAAINAYVSNVPVPAAGPPPPTPPKGPILRGPRRWGGLRPGAPLNNSEAALKINGALLQNGNTNAIYRFKGNYYAKAKNPNPQELVNGRRNGVYYRVNVAQNKPLTFRFSTANNLKGKEYVLRNGQFVSEPTATQVNNANLKMFRNWYATQAGLETNKNRAEVFRQIRNRNLGNRPANGNAKQANYNRNKKLQNVFKTMNANRNRGNGTNQSRYEFWAEVQKLNYAAQQAAEAAPPPVPPAAGGA